MKLGGLFALALAAPALASCSDGTSFVVVDIGSGTSLAITSLNATVTNAGDTAHLSIMHGASFVVPPPQSFSVEFKKGRSGDVNVDVKALAGSREIAHASGTTSINAGGTAMLSIMLLPEIVDMGSDGTTANPDLATPPDLTASADLIHLPGWTLEKSTTINKIDSIWGNGNGELYAVGAGGTILHSLDDGNIWTAQTSTTGNELYSVWGSVFSDIWAVGFAATLLHSTGKNDWQAQASNVQTALDRVWGTSSTDVYVAADVGTVIHSTDFGKTWTTATSNLTGNRLWGMYGLATNDIYAVGNGGAILHNKGGIWSLAYNMPPSCFNVFASSPNAVYASCAGVLLATTDQGSTWAALTNVNSRAVWSVGNDIYATAPNVTVVHSADAGKTWETIMTPLTGQNIALWGIWGTSPTDYFVVGENGTILHYK